MKSLVRVLVIAVVAAAGTASSAQAVPCNDGTSQKRDYSGSPDPQAADYNANYGHPTHEDDIATLPGGTLVYGHVDPSNLDRNYIGATGSAGYVEVYLRTEGSPTVEVDGSSRDGSTEGRIRLFTGDTPDACVNGWDIL